MVLNRTNPRLALGEMALSSPATHSSNGAIPEITVRSNVAMAFPRVAAVRPSPGYARSNIARYPGMPRSVSSARGSGMFISSGGLDGPEGLLLEARARPSQNSRSAQARFRIVGVRRPSCFMPWPTARGNPSPHEKAGLWQVAQDMTPDPDSRGSKKSVRPSSARSFE